MHDLVIRGGTVVDGTGVRPLTGDVAVTGGRIVDIGRDVGPARRVLDADGLLVTPGWVDIHSHYDGQALWDPLLETSAAARGHHRGHGQLRRGLRAREARGPRCGRSNSWKGWRTSRRPCSTKASTGVGRASPSTSTHSTRPRTRSTSRRSCRTRRCACSPWVSAASTTPRSRPTTRSRPWRRGGGGDRRRCRRVHLVPLAQPRVVRRAHHPVVLCHRPRTAGRGGGDGEDR